MFTEGLDEAAISWINQGTGVDLKPRSPLTERIAAISVDPPSLNGNVPLPPLKLFSGVIGPIPSIIADFNDDVESIASAPSGVNLSYSDSLMSSDSDLFSNSAGKVCEEEVKSYAHRSLARDAAMENLKIEIPANSRRNDFEDHDQIEELSSRVQEQFVCMGTPSAPPIRENSGDQIRVLEDEHKEDTENFVNDQRETVEIINEPSETILTANVDDPYPAMKSYHSSSQNAWQIFVAYDACFRLCLNAWARGCMEAPQFLQDECLLLRSAFGLQRFLLQPRGHVLRDESPKGTDVVKEKKMIGKMKIEVRKIRLINQRKFHGDYSPRALLMKSGAEYVRQASALLRTQINSLKITSSPVSQEDPLYCLLSLRNSSGEEHEDKGPAICLRPGSGESHLFYPESQGDMIFIDVQNSSKATHGRAVVPVSALSQNPNDGDQWWPIYRDDNECVGKIKILVSCFDNHEGMNNMKGGNVVETLVYDSVLEAVMRAQCARPRNLQIKGPWKWLLSEFADYYGVSDVYAKLRYVSHVMTMATPTKDCLELLHELLLSAVKARHENSLNRQEKALLLECETQVENLLAITFRNYKLLDDKSPTGLAESYHQSLDRAPSALASAVQLYSLLHDILSQDGQSTLKKYLRTAAAERCRRLMVETDEFSMVNSESLVNDPITISTAYQKMKGLCLSMKSEIEIDIKIHNQHILPSSIDLPSISASVYSSELCKRLRTFLAACPPFGPVSHVTDLLSASADFERDLHSWAIPQAQGGLVSKEIFHDYIMVWIQETRLHLLEQCKSEKLPSFGALTNSSTSPFVESMYEQIRAALGEYEVVINRWPNYLLHLEAAVADVERTIMKTLEKQYGEILAPLRDGFPKLLEKHVQKLTGRQSTPIYLVPDPLGTFVNTVKRMLDTLHGRVEQILRSWEPALTVMVDGKSTFGEQMNGVTVLLRKKFKNYVEAIVEKLLANTKVARATRLKRVLEETRESDSEADVRERLGPLCLLLTDSIRNLHGCFSSRIFVTICRGLWDRMGQIVLEFLESRKENRVWYRASDHALLVLDDFFASQMQMLQGNSLREKDLDPPRSVVEARSILR